MHHKQRGHDLRHHVPRHCAHGQEVSATLAASRRVSDFGDGLSHECRPLAPSERTILNFAEGDVTRTICDTDEEFAAAVREIDRWNRDHGYGPARIDPGFDPALKAAFEAVGLGDINRGRALKTTTGSCSRGRVVRLQIMH